MCTPTSAAERLVMPFACEAKGARVHLTPAPETAYRILGVHVQEPLTTCAPMSPQQCRTWMTHKFDLDCGGARVAWLSVIAGLLEQRPWRGAVIDGRLHVRLGAGPRGAKNAAAERAYGNVVMPAGFAPVLGSGARFVTASAAPLPPLPLPAPRQSVGDALHAAQLRDAGSDGGWETKVTAVAGASFALRRTTEGRSTVVQTGGRWTAATTAEAGASSEVSVMPLGRRGMSWALVLVGLAIAAASLAIIIVLRWRQAGASHDVDQAARAGDQAANLAAHAMVRTAEALLAGVRRQVDRLEAEELRAALRVELAGIERRLRSPLLAAQLTGNDWAVAEVTIGEVGRQLGQVQALLDAAAAEPNASAETLALPSTREEAFAYLGVNPLADDRAVKKVVDGLRLSWHPDRAEGEHDRLLREHRTKGINVAWDILSRPQRAAAA